ncbi:MAG: hypothetical protein K0Q49_427 [Haloplasmataceae bacterium]|jgi:hypothetical protein|nr:hypothetical protein [Haloplasmataceae bacterium]
MMDDKKISTFIAWAPDHVNWTAWSKPVLFATLSNNDFEEREIKEVKDIDWINVVDNQTAIILDLPGERTVTVAITLAKRGYRPVLLYNGCKGPSEKSMIVNVTPITNLLYSGGKIIESAQIRDDAAPVFMLDSRRMEGYSKSPGKYDNRWCIFAQDMPSGKYLKNAGFNKVLIFSENVESDLSHILFRYQQENIQIQIVKNNKDISDIKVSKPSRFKSLLYRSSILFGLRRNATGGFGGRVPEPMEHNSGIGYRGIG